MGRLGMQLDLLMQHALVQCPGQRKPYADYTTVLFVVTAAQLLTVTVPTH
jgi:hypothetical protein